MEIKNFIHVLVVLLIVLNFGNAQKYIECEETKNDRNYKGLDCTFKNVKLVQGNSNQGDSDQVDFRISSYIKNILFENSTVHEIPRSMFQRIQSVTNLTMKNVGLVDELNKYALEYAVNLVVLNLAENNLTILDKKAFSGARKLEVIDLSWNQIIQVDPSAFMYLNKLKKLNLAHNSLKVLDVDVFQALEATTLIDISFNNLIELHEETFKNCKMLKNVAVAANSLIEFDVKVPYTLIKLDLGHNELMKCNIKPVNDDAINSLRDHLKISVTNNSLINFDIDPNFILTHLDLSRNSFKDLSNISSIYTLIDLNLAFNPIGQLQLNIFDGMHDLLYLNLENINMEKLDFGTLSLNTKLKQLDISYNNITEIDLDMLAALSNLEDLSLIGNNLTTFDYKNLLDLFPKLRYIGISNNNWDCKTLANILKYLNKQDIRLLEDVNSNSMQKGSNLKGISCTTEPALMTNMADNDDVNGIFDVTEYNEIKKRLLKMNSKYGTNKSNSNMIPKYYDKATQEDVNASTDIKAIKIMVFILLLINVVFFGIKLGRYIKTKKSSRSIRLSGGVKDENYLDDLVA